MRHEPKQKSIETFSMWRLSLHLGVQIVFLKPSAFQPQEEAAAESLRDEPEAHVDDMTPEPCFNSLIINGSHDMIP